MLKKLRLKFISKIYNNNNYKYFFLNHTIIALVDNSDDVLNVLIRYLCLQSL